MSDILEVNDEGEEVFIEIPVSEKRKAGRDKPEVKDYEVRMWGGRIPVYVCGHCGRQYNDKDRLLTHVLYHYPEGERNEKLDELVKE